MSFFFFCDRAFFFARDFAVFRYHREPKLGDKLDRSAMAETVVLVACRGGLRDEEVGAF